LPKEWIPFTHHTADSAVGEQDISHRLHELLLQDQDISGFLDALAVASAEHISHDRTVLCGITLRRRRRNAVVASSSAEAKRLDELQTGFDQGPCMHAQQTGELILVHDVGQETRWPEYMRTVREQGLRSVMAIPLE